MKKLFIPLQDDYIYAHPELLQQGYVPYRFHYRCHHWLESTRVGQGGKQPGRITGDQS